MKLEGKVAVIVGGECPLGREAAKKFLSEGAKVAIAWFAENEWEEAKGLVANYTGQYIDVHVDASKEDQVAGLMQKAKNTFGSVDILLSTVGMFFVGPMLWETDTVLFDKLLETNLKTAFLCSKYAIRYMLEKGWGRIVVFPSRFVIQPQPRFGAYAVSKAGLVTLMLALREELKDTKITANAIMPDVMDTPKTQKMPNADPDKWVKPSAVAQLLCDICSEDGEVLNGSTLRVWGKL